MHSRHNQSFKRGLFSLLIAFFAITLPGCDKGKEASEPVAVEPVAVDDLRGEGWSVRPKINFNPVQTFVLIDDAQWENADIYHSAITEICARSEPRRLCVVSFWTDASFVPKVSHITDAQSDEMVAGWNSNEGRLIWRCDNKNADPHQCFAVKRK